MFRIIFKFLLVLIPLSIIIPTSLLTGSEDKLYYLDQLPPLIDREIFFDDPEISGAQVSPDGQYISFRKPYQDVMNIWVKRIEEDFDNARPITADTIRPITGYFWSRDSKYILYVQDKGGDENFNVYAVNPSDPIDPETGVPPARNLTDMENVRTGIYAVPRNTPDYIIVGLNDRNPALFDVYRIQIASGEKELLYRNDHNILGWNIDDDGNLRFATRMTDDGGTEILKPIGDDFKQVYSVAFEESASITRFHPDGKRVYMVTNKGEDVDLTKLVLFDSETGEKEFIEKDPEREVNFGGAIFSNITDELLATMYVGDRLRIYFHNEDFERDYEKIKSDLPDGDVYIGSQTDDETIRLVNVTSDVDPGATYLYDKNTGTIEFLYRPRPNLPTEYLANMIPIRYRARDGLEIPGYLTLPKNVKPENLAVVVMPHGGPWARDRWGYSSYAQFFANRGYATFQPNFRGSSGYGKVFLNAGNREWGTGYMQHDITDGVKYLIEEGIADPDRVSIFGGSYGGYATLAGLAFTPDLYAAGVSFVGPSNIITLIDSFPAYWRPAIKIWTLRVGDPDDSEERKRLIEQSPLFSAHNITAPLFVVQGANDPRVTKHESDQIVVALRDLDRHVEYIVAPDEGHGFARRENRLAFTYALERFFADHLGGRYQKDLPPDIAERLDEITVDIREVTLPEELVGYEDAAIRQLPVFSGENIHSKTLYYSMILETGGRELNMRSVRSVKEKNLNGKSCWQIIDNSTGLMGEQADTFYVDYRTLQPIRRSAQQGMAVITIEYNEKSISGSIKVGGEENPINTTLEAPVMADGSALDISLAGLPLEVGYETVIRTFDLMNQKPLIRLLRVTGVEEIEIPAGRLEAYIVEIIPIEGDMGERNLWISVDEPRNVLKSIDALPPMMGGGTITAVLEKTE